MHESNGGFTAYLFSRGEGPGTGKNNTIAGRIILCRDILLDDAPLSCGFMCNTFAVSMMFLLCMMLLNRVPGGGGLPPYLS